MSVDKAAVKKISKLANLYFKEEEIEGFTKDLNQILQYVDKLTPLDTKGINPTFQVAPIENIYRDDVVQKSLDLGRVLSNTPDKDGEFFKVPKIIE